MDGPVMVTINQGMTIKDLMLTDMQVTKRKHIGLHHAILLDESEAQCIRLYTTEPSVNSIRWTLVNSAPWYDRVQSWRILQYFGAG